MDVDGDDTSTCHQVTKFCYKKALLNWTIYNFALSEKAGCRALKSKTFTNEYTKSVWYVKLRASGNCERNRGYVCVYMYLKASPKETVHAKFKISFYNSDKSCIYQSEFIKSDFIPSYKGCSLLNIRKKEEFFNSITGDTLRVQIDVREITDEGTRLVSELPCGSQALQQALTAELSGILESRKFCDMVLSVRGTEIPVHRVVMAGASPVFEAVLERQIIENVAHRIEITDFEPGVVQEVINFVYSRKKPEFSRFDIDFCLDVLRAANKFVLQELKFLAISHLTSNLDVDNAVKILLVAHQHSIIWLEKECLKFICANGLELTELESFRGSKANLWKEIAFHCMENSGSMQVPDGV